MRNWGKRIAAMVLALCCALLLTGCSSVEGVEKKIDAIGNVHWTVKRQSKRRRRPMPP